VIPGKPYTPELLLGIAWRRKWLIVIPAILIAAAVAIVTYRLPNLYRSDTLILVVPQRVPESYVRSTVTTRIEDRLQSISQQVRSRTRLERIIQDFNLYSERRKTEIMQDIVEEMNRNISIDIVRGDAFRVSFTDQDPRVAMRVTERLASFFIDESLRDREVLAEGTNQFLESQLQEARRRLVENEQKLADYRRRFDGQLPDQAEGNLQGLHNTQLQLQALLDSLNRDRDRRLVLERMLADLAAPDSAPAAAPARVAGASQADNEALPAAQRLEAAEAALRGILLRLTEEHPDVQRLKRTIAELRRRAEVEAAAVPVSTPASPAEIARLNRIREARGEIDRVAREIESKEANERRLRDLLAQYQQRIEATPARQSELTELMRDYSTLQNSYASLLAKHQESQISANLERRQIGEQFRVLDPARVPEKPASPNRLRIYMMGFLVALAVGLACAGAAEYLDRGLRSEEDVRLALALPVLATIPLLAPVKQRSRRALVAGSIVASLMTLAALAAIAWTMAF
jgi:polysaccharide chain length determinant protein (PEP-CTERM system associated)